MLLVEEQRDLFTVPDDYFLAHCIASDLRMGAGIAVPMAEKFGLREALKGKDVRFPTCVLTGRVFNLITKQRSWEKPTLASLEAAIREMRKIATEQGIDMIAMPRIGCGLDRLQWQRVRELLEDVFAADAIELLVCSWD